MTDAETWEAYATFHPLEHEGYLTEASWTHWMTVDAAIKAEGRRLADCGETVPTEFKELIASLESHGDLSPVPEVEIIGFDELDLWKPEHVLSGLRHQLQEEMLDHNGQKYVAERLGRVEPELPQNIVTLKDAIARIESGKRPAEHDWLRCWNEERHNEMIDRIYG